MKSYPDRPRLRAVKRHHLKFIVRYPLLNSLPLSYLPITAMHVLYRCLRRIGREMVQYVSNIYKYCIAYRLIADKL